MLDIDGNELHAEDVINPEYLDVYRDQYRVVYGHLALVKNYLFIMDQIDSFPFELFTHELARTFWTLATKALFDETILALWLLTSEEENERRKRGRFAVDNFGKRVIDIYLKKGICSVRQHLQIELEKVDFDNRIAPLKQKISNIRNHHVAHLDFDTQMGFRKDDPVQYGMTVPDMHKALEIAHELFVVFSFDGYPSLDYWEYAHHPDKKEFLTDIDDLLTFVASRSNLIRRFATDSEKARSRARSAKLPDDKKKIVENWQQRVDNLFGKDE